MMTIVVLSPHLDDAVFSSGARIARMVEQGTRVVVATVFAGSPTEQLTPAARAFHRHAGEREDADLTSLRRAEDSMALARLGACPLHLHHSDALYRRHMGVPVYDRKGAAVTASSAIEESTLAAVHQDIESLVALYSPTEMWVSGAGSGHVDHRIVRERARAIWTRSTFVLYEWEDLPDGFERPILEQVCSSTIHAAAPQSAHVERKLSALREYESQLRALRLGSGEDAARLFAEHALRRYDETGQTEVLVRQ